MSLFIIYLMMENMDSIVQKQDVLLLRKFACLQSLLIRSIRLKKDGSRCFERVLSLKIKKYRPLYSIFFISSLNT